MKKSLLICLSVIVFITFIQVGNLNAQHDKSQNITVNPIGLVFGLITVEYEKAVSAKNSFTIRGNFLSRSLGDLDATIFGAGGSYRFSFRIGQHRCRWTMRIVQRLCYRALENPLFCRHLGNAQHRPGRSPSD